MANELIIRKRMKIVQEKMKAIIREIKKDYEQGKIKSPVELQHRISVDLQKFYDSIGESTLEVVKAWGPPYSSDHNKMIQQIYNDIRTLYEEIQNMTNDLKESFEQVELERKSFEKRITEAENIVKGVSLNINESQSKVIFRDHFVDLEHYDKEAVKMPAAYLSTNERLLTLARLESEEFNEYASITIVDGNGLPGNTHVVRSTGNSLKFDGEDGLHINLADILDRNMDTWFEYECFEINDKVRQKIEGKGLGYKEPVEWVRTMSDGLYLTIQIELSKGKNINWLSITPFIPYDKGASPCIFEEIEVSDGKGTLHKLAKNEPFDSAKGFLFPKLRCKTIKITLRQRFSYEIDVGHFFFKQLSKDDLTIMDSKVEQEGVLVHGEYPSITNLGVTYDTGKCQIVYPTYQFGDKIKDEERRKNELFHPSSTAPNIYVGVEQIPAQRYIIGIRDSVIASYQFTPVSEYVSKPFVSQNPIKEIELDVNYDIPEQFPKDQEWVEFYISVDKGQEWHRIYPRNIYQQSAITKYLFNSGTPKEARTTEVGYIDSLTPIHEVQFRIILKRPEGIEDASYYTPVIYGYELHAITQGEIGQ